MPTDIERLTTERPPVKRPGIGSVDAQRRLSLQRIGHLLAQRLAAVAVRHQKRSSSGNGSRPPCTCIPPSSAQRASVGTALPGLSRRGGSKACFSA